MGPFPERVDSQKLFDRNSLIRNKIKLIRFQRLADYLTNTEGEVAVEIEFSRDEEKHRVIRGNLRTTVSMQCQRCLQDSSQEVEASFNVVVVSSDAEAREVTFQLDTVLDDEDGFDLLSFLEDELILSLPIVASHLDIECAEQLNKLKKNLNTKSTQNTAFANLKELQEFKRLK